MDDQCFSLGLSIGGRGAFVASLVAGKLPPPENAWERGWFFDGAVICRIERGEIGPIAHIWQIASADRRFFLARYERLGEEWDVFPRRLWLAQGRDQGIRYSSAVPGTAPLLYQDAFKETPQWLQRLGLGLVVKSDRSWYPSEGGVIFGLALPYWFLCLLAAPLPLAWLNRHRRQRRAARRAKAGACAKCGYDLRATPDPAGARLAVCPECGAVAGAKTKSV